MDRKDVSEFSDQTRDRSRTTFLLAVKGNGKMAKSKKRGKKGSIKIGSDY